MSEAKDDLIARATVTLGDCAARIASLTEQVVSLARERDDALATISLLQSQYRKQQAHDTAIIEGLTRERMCDED